MSGVALNPFGDLIVKEPRRREEAVRGLNEQPLQVLFAQFERLATGSLPREIRKLGSAYLVTSEQPGYGKSHLIGRVFRELHGRATLVYVLPFQNPETVFQSLALAMAREMDFPDRADAGAWNREEATQLDHLAHAVLAHLVADLVESGRDVKTEEAERVEIAACLRADPLAAFNRGVAGPNWAEWMRSHFARLRPLFEEALARRGLTLPSAGAWLQVLFAYAFHPFKPAVRHACLDWLTALPLEAEDLAILGLRPADAMNADLGPAEANQICRARVAGLCELAAFFRPFVFCFDQTEVYGHQPMLARAFGLVVGRLVDEAANHLTLVTSNQEPWTERIVPYMETADRDRIARPSLTLQGLDRSQAEELATLRMAAAKADPERTKSFFAGEWLGGIFLPGSNEMGTRHFLQKCKERWDRSPAKPAPLAELYEEHRKKLLASPKRHFFEPDTLQWLVEEAAKGVEGITIEHPRERYFPVCWQMPQHTCYFGFVVGAHWKQWSAIAQAASEKDRGNSRPSKAVFFRTPEQPPIPGPKWSTADKIETAKAQYLQLISLDIEELGELYAARELFADAAQGDIAYTMAETLAFLRERLAPWWKRLRAPLEPAGASPVMQRPEERPATGSEDLAQQVRRIVQKARFTNVEEVIAELKETHATPEAVLEACGSSAEIRVHPEDGKTILHWQDDLEIPAGAPKI